MKFLTSLLCVAALVSRLVAQSPAAAKPFFKLEGEKWTYTAGDRSFVGYLIKPEGNGPFPAVVINHGKGGRPDQFSVNWAREMVKWGLVGICPTLTHVAGTEIQGQDGASAENIQRVNDCFAILAGLGYVDMKRVAVTGHSMGSFLTIGFCGSEPAKVKAAAISAGGASTREGAPMPTLALASHITAPFLILHGTIDQAVAYETSTALKGVLDKNKIPNRHVTFVGTDHGMPTNPATRPAVLAHIREWFAAQGVLDVGKNSAPTLTPPADLTVAAAATAAPIKFTIADRENKPDALTVTATTSNSKVLPVANLALAGTGAERTVTATPAAGEAGPATIFLTVSDGTRVATNSFVVSFADASGNVPQPVIQRGPPGGRGRGPGGPGAPGARGGAGAAPASGTPRPNDGG